MKKYLLISSAIMVLVLAGCSKTEVPQDGSTSSTTDNTQNVSTGQVESAESLSITCSPMIKKTLEKLMADNKNLDKNSKKVETGHKISVHYIGRLDDKEVFDTSREEIAKACGKHTPGRNYNEGLGFTVGAGQMIAGFDKGVEGMVVGETKTIKIPAKEAYGERSKEALITIKKDQLPEGAAVKGMKLMAGNGQQVTVYSVDGNDVVIDTNHELAGKDLIFDITVLEIIK